MTEFETLELRVTALCARMAAMESAQAEHQCACGPCLEAQVEALAAGLDPRLVIQFKQGAGRRKLAALLQTRGWGKPRIARVLFCSERTVERWLAPARPKGPARGRHRTRFGA